MGIASKTIQYTAAMVEELYKGKRALGLKHAAAVKKLSVKKPAMAEGLNVAGQKLNKAFNFTAGKIKRYPKITSGVGGGVLFDIFTKDYEDEKY